MAEAWADEVEGVLSVWQARRGTGTGPSAETLCEGRPDLLTEVRRRIEAVLKVEGLLPTASFVGLATTAGLESGLAGPAGGDDLAWLDPPDRPGDLGRIGPYRITGELGRGGMGVVLRGEDDRLGRSVAVKVLNADRSPEARGRFSREARSAAAVEHERVVPVYHVDEIRGLPYLVMPLLRGESLADRLAQGPVPLGEALVIGRHIAEGLAAAHERGLTHRDVKPANVWLREPDGAALLLDFGLARAAGGAPALTTPGAVVGTPAYMAPEQADGAVVDHRADLFALGCVLYELTTGRRAFTGPTLLAVLRALAAHDPTPPRDLVAGLPPDLDGLIRRLLSKAPAGRPDTAAAVVGELRQIEATVAGGPGRTTHWLGCRPVMLGLAAGVLLLAGVGGLWLARDTRKPVDGPGDHQASGSDSASALAPAPASAPAVNALPPPLTGGLAVRVWSATRGKQGLRVGVDAGAVPVVEDDQIQVEAAASAPAYLYLLWLDGRGSVAPLAPWNLGDELTIDRPGPAPASATRTSLRSPPDPGKGWPVDDTPGLETILLLGRRAPWPAGFDLTAALGEVPAAPLGPPGEVVVRGWDRGDPTPGLALDLDRGPKKVATRLDDQLTQVVARVARHFELIRAVRFAHARRSP